MTRSRNSRKDLSLLEQRILLALNEKPGMDDIDVADEVGIVAVEASRILRRLEDLGFVARQAPKEQP